MDKNFWPPILALSIPIVALLIPLVGIALNYWLKARKTQLLHETLRKFAELGQPVPEWLLTQDTEAQTPPLASGREQRALRAALLLRKATLSVCLGLGLALVLFLLDLDNGEPPAGMAWSIGLLPLLLGLGWLLVWRHETQQLVREAVADTAPQTHPTPPTPPAPGA